MSEIGGFGPLVITPQQRQAQVQRMEQVQQTLETGPSAIAQLTPETAAAQYSYFSQVQEDIGTVRNGSSFPSLPPVPGLGGQRVG